MKNIKKIIKIFLVLTFFFILFKQIDINKLYEVFLSTLNHKIYYIPVVFFYFLSFVFQYYLWKSLLTKNGIYVNDRINLLANIDSLLANMVIPGKIGLFYKAIILNKYTKTGLKFLSTLIVFESIYALIITINGLLWFGLSFYSKSLYYNIYFFVLYLFLFNYIFILLFHFIYNQFFKIINKWFKSQIVVIRFTKKNIFMFSVFATMIYLTLTYSIYFICKMFSLNLTFIDSSTSVYIGQISSILSITPSGLGFKELLVTYYFKFISVSKEIGLSIALLDRFLFLIILIFIRIILKFKKNNLTDKRI